MYKFLICGFIVGTSGLSFASDVKVTSFKFLQSGRYYSPTAEICGVLIKPTGNFEMIKITSDPGSKGPAPYLTWASKDGKFCHIIATYTGKAEADLAD